MSCNNTDTENKLSMEEYLAAKAKIEDQIDYQFIQRLITELTQSCALPLPIPASAIPPLILQAAQWFWENDDFASIKKWYCLPYSEIQKCGPNNIFRLPEQILSVCGVYKRRDMWGSSILGDFSLERLIMNNSVFASSIGGNLNNVYGSGGNWSLTDVVSSLYEIQSFKAIFDCPLTFDYNMYSHELSIQGALRDTDLILDTFQRVRLQDLYKNYYFFRWCVCLGKRSMAQILGTFEFKLPGGVTLNYSTFRDQADAEMTSIEEHIMKQHSPDYFYNSNTI